MKTRGKKPNILILYGNYGGGHKRASQALAESFQKEFPEANIIIEDFLGQAFPVGDWFFRTLYLQTFYWAKSAYGWLYYKTKEMPADAPLFQTISYIGVWKLEKYLKTIQPDIVISTFPALTGMLAKVKERNNVFFNLWCVLTDYTSHSQWFYKSVDQYFVPTEDVGEQATLLGIDPHTIKSTGIPIMPIFYQKRERHSLLNKWNLRHDQPIILLSAGAFGVTNLGDVCEELIHTCPGVQFIVICGRNQKLYSRLQAIRAQGNQMILPLPFVKEIDELMQLADVFVTKPGGLSVSEAIACGLPMVLCKSMPGQELENAKYLIASGAAKYIETTSDLVSVITHLINNPEVLEAMKLQIQAIRQQLSPAENIARLAKKAFQNKPSTFGKEMYIKPQLISEERISEVF